MKVKIEELMGRRAFYKLKIRGINNRVSFRVPVKIVGTSVQCGSLNVRIRPVGGRGSAWVRRSAVQVCSDVTLEDWQDRAQSRTPFGQ